MRSDMHACRKILFRCRTQGQSQLEDRSGRRGVFDGHISAVILDDFLNHGQSHPCSVFLAVADERLEELVTNCFGDPRSIVFQENAQLVIRAPEPDLNASGFPRYSLTGVQEKVLQGSFKFLRVEPAFSRAVGGYIDPDAMLDKYVVRRIEDRYHSKGIRIAARIVLNPVQSFANFMNFEYPWHRENRENPSDYESSAYYASYAQNQSRESTTYPLVPKFEITATLPSVMNIGDLSCLGGGGVGGFRLSDTWQWTAEVSGCTLGNSLPQNWSGDSLTFTTGPQWIRHTESRWSPHVHMRLGGQKITLQHTDPEKRHLIESLVPPGTKLNPYYNLFNTNYESTGVSLSMGGGVDYRLYSGLALRVANLDYVRSWLAPVNGIDFNRGVRFTTGVVLRVGTW